jgi:hypothetical protein
MDLDEAFRIISRHRSEATLQPDHICTSEPHGGFLKAGEALNPLQPHRRSACSLPNSAVYTELDATLDTPEALERRLSRGGDLKP